MGEHGDLEPSGDRRACGGDHVVDVLADACRYRDRSPEIGRCDREAAEPPGPGRRVVAHGQVLAQEGGRHRLTPAIGRVGRGPGAWTVRDREQATGRAGGAGGDQSPEHDPSHHPQDPRTA
jgi:hypothetical protein